MKQFFKENAKFYWLPLILVSFIAFKLIDDYKEVGSFARFLLNILTPVIIGIVVAYLLNPLAEFMRKKWKMKWGICVLLVYLAFLLLIIIAVYFVVPAVIASLKDIIVNIPSYVNKTQTAISKAINSAGLTDSASYSAGMKKIDTFFGQFLSIIKGTFGGVSNAVLTMASSVANFFIGLIISVYLLKDKKQFILLLKKTIYALLGKNNGDFILACCHDANVVFSNYFIALMLDSFVVGIIDTVGLLLLRAPYAVLMGMLMGLVNLIPYFGAIIGGAIVIIVTVIFGGFMKALVVLLVILVVSQLDGMIIGPKIFGSKIGVNPFWVIFSITLGGGFLGLPGMLLGTPVVVIVGLFISRYIEKRLQEQEIDIDSEAK